MSYSYSITDDFKNATEVDIAVLQKNINTDTSVPATVSTVNTLGDIITLTLTSTLTTEEKTALDNIITNYVFVEPITSEIYDAIVDVNGNGDYLLPSEAFADGRLSVFLRNGTYMETGNIVIPNYGSITGESGGNVVINFSGLANGIIADGSGDVAEITGTIAVTKLSKTIVGTGTTFTNLNPLDFILIGTNYYQIASITDDTHLELVDTYRGMNVSGFAYIAQTMYTGIMLTKIIVVGSTTTGIYFRACRHFTLIAVVIKQNNPNLNIIKCGDSAVLHVLIDYGAGAAGIVIDDCASISFDTADVFNNQGHGISITGSDESLIFKSCETSNNGGDGIHIDGTCVDLGITTSVIKTNVGDGIYVGVNTQNVHLTQLTCRNNGKCGLRALGNEHNLTSNFCNDNNESGIYIHGDDSIVNGNTCRRNTISGIKVITGSTDNIIVNNNIKSNTGTNLDDLGTTTAKSDNKGA
jgi:hypothetical protein